MHVTIRKPLPLRPIGVITATPLTVARDYLALTRPRITLVVALTACPPFLVHHGARLDALAFAGVLLGIALVGAGSSAINAWHERDLDALMPRTQDRPLPAGRISPAEALGFGLLTSALGIVALGVSGGPLAALLGGLTLVYYIAVYTVWAKPRTAHSTVIGAVAGAAAPLIADAAVNGRVTGFGLALFAIIFAWQPPHVWVIALFRKHEYARAGIPMMPAVVGDRGTRRRMLGWALAAVPVSLVPWLRGDLGPAYAITAVAAGAWFAGMIARSMRPRDPRADRRVFFASLVYLTTLFLEMIVELALR